MVGLGLGLWGSKLAVMWVKSEIKQRLRVNKRFPGSQFICIALFEAPPELQMHKYQYK